MYLIDFIGEWGLGFYWGGVGGQIGQWGNVRNTPSIIFYNLFTRGSPSLQGVARSHSFASLIRLKLINIIIIVGRMFLAND